ncbi:hypothetical protein BDV36DRAFT_253022 [Aspergillus pseudocaelatus]|uniref:Uncharacterized protein n=1 Tax=Aspergillus pseudocaelatus TaxID=1825620 RepID=A0ABQ6WNQ6_9EURO|nr:hypothetical protein BDV36DRAFT_253022 [Aspergillus pseudocaelatus]
MLDFFCSCPIGRWSYFFNTPRTLWEKGIWIDFRSGYCVVFCGTSMYTVSFSLPLVISFCSPVFPYCFAICYNYTPVTHFPYLTLR